MTERRVQTNFYSSKRQKAIWAAEDAAVAAVPVQTIDPDADVPDGTANEIISWVGGSLVRAQNALAAEEATSDPRKTLLTTLRRMVDRAKA